MMSGCCHRDDHRAIAIQCIRFSTPQFWLKIILLYFFAELSITDGVSIAVVAVETVVLGIGYEV